MIRKFMKTGCLARRTGNAVNTAVGGQGLKKIIANGGGKGKGDWERSRDVKSRPRKSAGFCACHSSI